MRIRAASRHRPAAARIRGEAFSLLEVMVACGIFFVAVFSILGIVGTALKSARSLRSTSIDAGMVAAQIYKTNRLTEGTDSGDFGEIYQDYTWETRTSEVATNGLFQVDITLIRRGKKEPADSMSIFIFSPESAGLGNLRR
jgi:Tfp pilus assembly protein PilV